MIDLAEDHYKIDIKKKFTNTRSDTTQWGYERCTLK